MQNTNRLQTTDKVLVVGGGLGGIRTALDLAEAEKISKESGRTMFVVAGKKT